MPKQLLAPSTPWQDRASQPHAYHMQRLLAAAASKGKAGTALIIALSNRSPRPTGDVGE